MKKCCCNSKRAFNIILKDNNLPDRTNRCNLREGRMSMLSGGSFLMGTDSDEGFREDGEGPVHEVKLSAFSIDVTCVTNKEFSTFIEETGYVTDAERYGWSFVFYKLLSEKYLKGETKFSAQTPWWYAIDGATWNHPEGPSTDIFERMEHPVVHVSWNDAMAYCKWTNKRLPTEAEWEYAARGGLVQKRFPWGDELEPNGEYKCNIWHGVFPDFNTLEDGFLGTAPAKSFAPNSFGLYNVSGNVWEWCQDWFSSKYHENCNNIDPKGPKNGSTKVIKGGSFLCHYSFCNRYRLAARTSNTPNSSSSNMGFRCAK